MFLFLKMRWIVVLAWCLMERALGLAHFDKVYVQFGANVGPRMEHNVLGYLKLVSSSMVTQFARDSTSLPSTSSDERTLVMSIGDTSLGNTLIGSKVLSSLVDESFAIVSSDIELSVVHLACNGRPLSAETHKNISFDRHAIHYGAVVSAYACLELLGFAFLHPLEPFIPLHLTIPREDCIISDTSQKAVVHKIESPYWPERSFHIHTQHPLELTEVLQGHDIPQVGPHGPHCSLFKKASPLRPSRATHATTTTTTTTTGAAAGAAASASTAASAVKSHQQRPVDKHSRVPYCERWEDMVSDVDLMFQWAVANRLNKIEWLLLGNYKWGDELETRQRRLLLLTSLGHEYSLMVGADCPLGNIQQHAWHMVNVRLPYQEQVQQIKYVPV